MRRCQDAARGGSTLAGPAVTAIGLGLARSGRAVVGGRAAGRDIASAGLTSSVHLLDCVSVRLSV